MKYVIIEESIIMSSGALTSSHQITTEVFDNYIMALKFMVKERRVAKLCEYEVKVKKIRNRSQYGRELMFEMVTKSDDVKIIQQIVRVPENGFHG